MEHTLLSNLVSKSIELGRVRERIENFVLLSDKSNDKIYEGLKSRENQLFIETEVLKKVMIEAYWNKINE